MQKYEELLPIIYEEIMQNNMSITKLSKQYGLNRNKVSKMLKENYGYESPNANFSKMANKKDFEKLDLIALERYNNGESLTSISKDLGLKRQSLSKRLQEKFNIDITMNNAKKFNENYFDTYSSNMFHLLGLFIADGSISEDNKFEICSKDKDIIEKVKKELQSEHKISVRTVDGREYYRLGIKNKNLCDSLRRFNIVERKSYMEIDLPDIPEEYFGDFLRGIIDGDGMYGEYEKRIRITITVGHVNEKFARQLIDKIFKLTGVQFKLYRHKTCLSLTLNKKQDCKKMINYMYDDNCDIYLDRKHRKAINVLLPS